MDRLLSDFDECECSCHRSRSKRHMMTCCYKCKYCEKNIKRKLFRKHQEKCKEEYKKLVETVSGLLAGKDILRKEQDKRNKLGDVKDKDPAKEYLEKDKKY